MRLIDADKLKDTLLKYHYTTEHNQIFRYIDEQPTAYSVERVVELLENDESHTFDGCINKRYAIEIVKGGGVNE